MDKVMERFAVIIKPVEFCCKMGIQPCKAVSKNEGISLAGRPHGACFKGRCGKGGNAAAV